MSSLADALKAFRERNNIKQDEIARILGVSQSAVSLWESGHVIPSKRYRLRIEAAIMGSEERTTVGSLKRFVIRASAALVLMDDKFRVLARSKAFSAWQFQELCSFPVFKDATKKIYRDFKKPTFRESTMTLRFKHRIFTFRNNKIFNAVHCYNLAEVISIADDHSGGNDVVLDYYPEFDEEFAAGD